MKAGRIHKENYSADSQVKLGAYSGKVQHFIAEQHTCDVGNSLLSPPEVRLQLAAITLQPQATVTDAWNAIVSLLQSGAIKTIVTNTFPLTEAAEALRYLVEGRPFGRVVLAI
jgi:NADPH:quinone reductase-like Zn-dependent oxidoreductase